MAKVKKPAVKKKTTPNAIVSLRCFLCNGTGKNCNICGDPENACECDEIEIERHCEGLGMPQFGDCENCNGKGVV